MLLILLIIKINITDLYLIITYKPLKPVQHIANKIHFSFLVAISKHKIKYWAT